MSKYTIHGWYKLFIFFITLYFSSLFISDTAYSMPSVEGIQVYQKNIHLSPERKQKLANDVTRYRNADNLWDVLREEFSLPHYEENPAVQEKIEWFMNNQDFLLRSAMRAAPYLYYILQQVKKRHLPAELVLLPIVESAYNPFSLSPVGAAGIWQLMPGTASGLGVKQTGWYDGRRDVIESTRAALNYLAYLQSFFEGNWLYAIAAYNTGEGNLLSAIKRNIRDGRDTNFWSLPVAQQTKDYVPSLLALAVIISRPNEYPVYFPPVRNAPYLAQVDIGKQIELEYAASLAGISFKKMVQLNPGFNRSSIAAGKGPNKLVLPIENVEQFTENLAMSPLGHEIDWVHYRSKPGDTLLSIAKKFGTTVAAIRKLNHLAKNNMHHGINLLIPANAEIETASIAEETELTKSTKKDLLRHYFQKKMPETYEDNVTLAEDGNYILQPGDTIYMIRTGETLESIAKRFHLNSQALRKANKLMSNRAQSGKQLIIPTHLSFESNSTDLANSGSNKKINPGDTIYMVRQGDTIAKIAQKFHTSPAMIRLINLVDDTSLMEGEKIVIPTHIRS